MPYDSRKNRFKLLGSLVVLTLVFLIAAIAQFTDIRPQSAEQSQVESTGLAAGKGSSQNRPRAVFGGEARPAPTSDPSPLPEAEDSRARTDDSSTKTAEINGLLDRWRSSIISGDVNAQTILYAPRMEHFFRQRNVSRASVQREKARMMELYPEVKQYDISDVRVESSKEDEAVVTFRKDWDMRGDRRFAGSERQRLKLRKFAGDWKIVSEEETKLYWVKRG
jgi:hypothetical protein